jgi:hypothetical protein
MLDWSFKQRNHLKVKQERDDSQEHYGYSSYRPQIMSIISRQEDSSTRATSLASIINDYRLLKMQVGYNCPYSDNDKINTDYVIKYPGKNHYDDAKNKRYNSP